MKQELDHDQVTAHVDADPSAVYSLLADVTRHADLSPEVDSASWLDGATFATPGARFEVRNRAGKRGWTWRNRPVIEVADAGREIAWSRTEPFAGTVVWRYVLEPEDGGTRVTSSYEVTAPISRVGWFIIGAVFACGDRRVELRAGMEQTMERLRELTAAEVAGGPAAP